MNTNYRISNSELLNILNHFLSKIQTVLMKRFLVFHWGVIFTDQKKVQLMYNYKKTVWKTLSCLVYSQNLSESHFQLVKVDIYRLRCISCVNMFSHSVSKKINLKFQNVDSGVGFTYLLYFRLSLNGHGVTSHFVITVALCNTWRTL